MGGVAIVFMFTKELLGSRHVKDLNEHQVVIWQCKEFHCCKSSVLQIDVLLHSANCSVRCHLQVGAC